MTDTKTALERTREELFTSYEVRDISYVRVELWEWFKAASTEKVWSFQGNPATVLFLQTTFQNLIRYAWELLEEGKDQLQVEAPNPPFSDKRIEQEKQYFNQLDHLLTKYHGIVRRLNQRETRQPLYYVHRFFEFQSPDKWCALLQEWVEYGLNNYSPIEMGIQPDLQAYELLDGLLEAIYLMENHKAANREHLAPMVQLIVEAVNPEMIFEVRHPYLTEDHQSSYTDLVIILSDHGGSFAEARPVVELATIQHPRVSCWLYAWSTFRASLQAGDLYLSMSCTPSTLIYTNGMKDLPDPSPHLAGARQKAQTTFRKGMSRATTFYQQSEAVADQALATYMIQQSAEWIFRTVCLALGGQEKKTHSFKVLKQTTRRVAPALNEVLPANTTEELRLLQLLEDAYINGRYANDFEVSEADFQTLHDRVEKLLSLSREIFYNRLESLHHKENYLLVKLSMDKA